MKNLYPLIAFLFFNIITSQEVMHINFDDVNPDVTFESWNNSSTFSLTNNPMPDPVNASNNVGQLTAGSDEGGNFDSNIGIGVMNPLNVFTSPFDLTSLDYFKMKIYALEEVTVTFHIENSPDWGNFLESTASISASELNQWVELTFDFEGANNIFMNNIVIKVSGPDWNVGDFLFFDEIIGPELYTTPAFVYTPEDGSNEISVGSVLDIETNDKFYDPGAVTITDFSNKVALRIGDENGPDVAFAASIINDSKITITPDEDLDFLTTYWFGAIDNTMYHSNGSFVTGVGASFTTKEAVSGNINVMLIDYETPETSIPFESWGSAGFVQTPNPAPDDINPSSSVGQFTHPGGVWSSTIETSPELEVIDFSETPYWNVKVWADKPINIVFKLQNNQNWWENSEFTYPLTSDETNQWVQLSFNFSNVTANNYNRIQMWFDGDLEGGSEVGDVYYFDDIEKSNVPPPAVVVFTPENGSTNVLQYSQLSIISNFAFVNMDGSDIENPVDVLELKENDSSGSPVPFYATISENNNMFTIVPVDVLSTGGTYWFGVQDGSVKFDENQQSVSGINSTFTVTNTQMPEMDIYEDFDGNSQCIVVESLGDPAGMYVLNAPDPTGVNNNVIQWTKGPSWGGWERVHFQLNSPFDGTLDDVFSFRVFSPVTTGIRFKLADAADDWEQTGNYETGSDSFPDPLIVVENQWQTFYLNVSNLADGVNFDHLFIFIGRGDGEPGVGSTFYIDDLMGPALQASASLVDMDIDNIVLYPNPANDKLYFKNITEEKSIIFFDLNGRIIKKLKTSEQNIDVSNFKTGLYFIEINGQIKKFIKR
tara:strand:- start:50917 stop:53388 length:2472 start_codon:yes stop_codon:yes gene_type:complete